MEQKDVNLVRAGIGDFWPTRVPDERNPLVLRYYRIGCRKTRNDVVSRVVLAVRQSLSDFGLVRYNLSSHRFGRAGEGIIPNPSPFQ